MQSNSFGNCSCFDVHVWNVYRLCNVMCVCACGNQRRMICLLGNQCTYFMIVLHRAKLIIIRTNTCFNRTIIHDTYIMRPRVCTSWVSTQFEVTLIHCSEWTDASVVHPSIEQWTMRTVGHGHPLSTYGKHKPNQQEKETRLASYSFDTMGVQVVIIYSQCSMEMWRNPWPWSMFECEYVFVVCACVFVCTPGNVLYLYVCVWVNRQVNISFRMRSNWNVCILRLCCARDVPQRGTLNNPNRTHQTQSICYIHNATRSGAEVTLSRWVTK